ncbi:MAG: thermonuclease family protein [Elusimicrobia bacterium]|nr:thermonuclease family protein [Elusimicrobiota bacterium]
MLFSLGGCAILKLVKESAFEINEKRFPYINWFVPAVRKIVNVNGIYDGDTVVVDEVGEGKTSGESDESSGIVVRLLGIDTPEVAHPEDGYFTDEPGAKEATEFTRKSVNWKKVIIVYDPENKQGVFGRRLALIFYYDAKGTMRCLNWELLRRNLASANLWATDLLCKKPDWNRMAKIAKLKIARDYLEMGRECLREKLVEDALEYYRKGLRKYPNYFYIRRDLAVLYGKLAKFENDKRKRASYVSRSLYHWKKLRGTKFDTEAKRQIEILTEKK